MSVRPQTFLAGVVCWCMLGPIVTVRAELIAGVELSGTGVAADEVLIEVGGFREGAWMYRTLYAPHWNETWLSAPGEPTIAEMGLVGADYIRFEISHASVADFNAAITLDRPATVYLFMHTDVAPQPEPWMTALGLVDTGHDLVVGADAMLTDNRANIYVATLPAGTHDFGPQASGLSKMYGVAAVPEPSAAAMAAMGLLLLGVCRLFGRRTR